MDRLLHSFSLHAETIVVTGNYSKSCKVEEEITAADENVWICNSVGLLKNSAVNCLFWYFQKKVAPYTNAFTCIQKPKYPFQVLYISEYAFLLQCYHISKFWGVSTIFCARSQYGKCVGGDDGAVVEYPCLS